jgi:hypothetical protein
MTIAQLVYAQGILFSYSGQYEFDPYEMDHRSAIEFLSEVAGGTGERRIAAKKAAAT